MNATKRETVVITPSRNAGMTSYTCADCGKAIRPSSSEKPRQRTARLVTVALTAVCFFYAPNVDAPSHSNNDHSVPDYDEETRLCFHTKAFRLVLRLTQILSAHSSVL